MWRRAGVSWGDGVGLLLLTPQRREDLGPMMRNAGCDPGIFIIQAVPHAEVADWMGLADFALTPVKPVPTKALCTPIKDGEYWALGLPVIITPGISDDSAIIERHSIGAVLNGLNAEACLLYTSPSPRDRTRSRMPSSACKTKHTMNKKNYL